MPIILPSEFSDGETAHAADPWVWLIEIQLQKPYRADPSTIVPSVLMRVSSYHSYFSWPPADPVVKWWDPFNFTFTPIEQTGDGDLPQMDLTIDNTARSLMRYLHAGDGLEGNYCKVYLVPLSAINIAYPNHVYQMWEFDISGALANDEAVTFRLEKANFFTKRTPQDRFIAARCRWNFGGDECGYVINAAAAYSTCAKTVTACALRGDDHVARGLIRLHPRRFGGFPGIPKQRS